MKLNEKDIGLIEAYIDGTLQGEDLKSFKQRLGVESNLAEQLASRKRLAELLTEADEYDQVKKQIGEIIRLEKPGFYQTYKYYILPIAASIIILMGVYLVFQFQKTPNENKIHVAETTDTISDLRMDEPDSYAERKVYDSILLLTPVNNNKYKVGEHIEFRWQAASENFGTLYVIDENNRIILEEKINLGTDSFKLNTKMFNSGYYRWYVGEEMLQDSSEMGSFLIIK